MNNLKLIDVLYDSRIVGKLALSKEEVVAFEYDAQWLIDGFSISPFSLPLKAGVFFPKSPMTFDGVFGVFSDSLPDGWGRLLVDRMLLKNHYHPSKVNILQRLSIVGSSGMGALEYHPVFEKDHIEEIHDFDKIAMECKNVLEDKDSDDMDTLFLLGGSSGGARPKALVHYNGGEWLVKFPSSNDSSHIGKQEFDYTLCAKACGIQVPNVHLFHSNTCEGYFGVERFDRYYDNDVLKKIHMVSVAGLLETTHRIPNLDYMTLMQLTQVLTNDFEQLLEMYRRMCFNVYAHNRDDHSKNFSFLYDEGLQKWKLSPAYDLTFSHSIGGEHATCINGNGNNPDLKDLLIVAKEFGIAQEQAKKIALHIKAIIHEQLGKYLENA